MNHQCHLLAVAIVCVLVANCDCRPAAPVPAGPSSIFCTCDCGAVISSLVPPKTLQACLTPDDLVDGEPPDPQAVLDRCEEICIGAATANLQDVGCLAFDDATCQAASCGVGFGVFTGCHRAAAGVADVFTAEEVDGVFTAPEGGVIGYGFDDGCRQEDGALRECERSECDFGNILGVNVVPGTCGDGVATGEEGCDGPCQITRSCPRVRPNGTVTCDADCTMNFDGCVADGEPVPEAPDPGDCNRQQADAFNKRISLVMKSTQCTVVGDPIAHCDDNEDEAPNVRDPDATEVPLCLAPSADPPVLVPQGLGMLSFDHTSEGVIDDETSSVLVVVAGGPDGGVRVPVTGRLELSGRPCFEGGCAIGASLDAVLPPFDTDFITPAGVPGHLHAGVTSISAQTTPDAIELNAELRGDIQAEELTGTARSEVIQTLAGLEVFRDHIAFFARPEETTTATINFAARTFRLRGSISVVGDAGVQRPDIDVIYDIRGTLTDIAPVAEAGPDHRVVCTDAAGTAVDLDGSASFDAEGDVSGHAWFREFAVPANRLGSGATFTVSPPLGRTRYMLLVADARSVLDTDVVTVDVEQGPAPVAVIDTAARVECTSPAGAAVVLSAASSSDPLGRALSFTWHAADGEVLGAGPSIDAALPFGETTIVVVVENACGGRATATRTFVVNDTTPPTIESFLFTGPMCLWPPNHDYAVLDIDRDIEAVIHDVCDENPRLVFASATSSEPDDGAGDGSTVDDVVLFDDHVCLRGERAGPGDGRRYAVGVHAVDARGNAFDPIIDIVVGHDQRPRERCLEIAPETVDDDDARCRPAAAASSVEPDASAAPPPAAADTEPPSSSSCASIAPGGPLLLLPLLLRRRRRGAAAMAVALIAACDPPPVSRDKALETCMLGVWQARLPLACDCDENAVDECAASDCEERAFRWFKTDGVVIEGTFSASVTAGRFSSVTTPTEKTWSVDGDEVVIGGLAPSAPTCTATELVINSARQVRAPEGAERSFEAAFDAAGWTGAAWLR